MDSSSFSNQSQSLSNSKSNSASYPGVEEVDVSYLRGEKKIGGGLTICELKIPFPLKVMENSIFSQWENSCVDISGKHALRVDHTA